MPDFVTTDSGAQRHFTTKARKLLADVAKVIYSNNSSISRVIEFGNFETIVRQAVADLHAAGAFDDSIDGFASDAKEKLVTEVALRVSKLGKEYTHYFPAWTLGMERQAPFQLGPVTFFIRDQWIDLVDFPESAKDNYLNEKSANYKWRKIVKKALGRPRRKVSLPGLAGVVYAAVSQCPSVLAVTIAGFEKDLSRKLAELVCKTALDAISLAFGGSEFFHQQAMRDERLQPVGSERLTESNGFLWLPGISLGPRIPHLSYGRVIEALAKMGGLLPSFSSILDALVDPASHAHPKLAQRWATALDWFAEGNREKSDAIALAKIGTALDVLACGGKFGGICDMVIHLTGVAGDKEVISGKQPKTLSSLVKSIYDDGRSKILHGNHYERMKSFQQERQHAAFLARVVLIEAAIRLNKYSGADVDDAFRTIPK